MLSTLVVCVAGSSAAAPSAPASRYASIVIEAETGAVLYERNADLPRYPASLTKVMTLYLTFEALASKKLSLSDQLTISAHAAGQDPSRLDVSAGTRIKVEDAIRAMTTKSANDAACAIAETLAGSEAQFAQKMTAKARAMGLAQTSFVNASGLPQDGQLSSARDLALLCKALVHDFPEQYHYFSAGTFDFRGTRYPNQNRFLHTYYGADGIKTGFVNASGHNLAASAVRGGKRLITIVLGGDTQSWTREHATRLLDVSYAKIDPSLVMVASNAANASPDSKVASRGVNVDMDVSVSAGSSATATSPASPPVAQAAAPAPAATYATPAGAVEVTAPPAIPVPNATANLTAFAAAASTPSLPAASVPPASPGGQKAAQATAQAPSSPSRVTVATGTSANTAPTAPGAPAPLPSAEQGSVNAAPVATAGSTATPAASSPPTPASGKPPAAPAVPAAEKATTDAKPAGAEQAARALLAHAQSPDAVKKPAAAPAPKPETAPAPAPAASPASNQPEAAAAAETHQSSVTTGSQGGDWSVQVGLFRDATTARRRGEEARNRMPLQLRDADLVVGRALDGVHVTSRISRLSEQDARAACSELQRGRMPCVVVPPGRPLIVATN